MKTVFILGLIGAYLIVFGDHFVVETFSNDTGGKDPGSEEFSLGIGDATKTEQSEIGKDIKEGLSKIAEKIKELPQIEDEVKNELLEIVRTEVEKLFCKNSKCAKKCRAKRCKRSRRCRRYCKRNCKCVTVDFD